MVDIDPLYPQSPIQPRSQLKSRRRLRPQICLLQGGGAEPSQIIMSKINIDPGLINALNEVQQPRSAFALTNFVVGAKHTDEAKYAQLVLELQIKYDAIRTSTLLVEQKQRKIAAIETPGRDGEIERELLQIELEQTQRAMLGAAREFTVLEKMWREWPKKYTHEEIQAGLEKEAVMQIEANLQDELVATGRPGVGSLLALRQLGACTPERINQIAQATNLLKEIK